VKMRPVIARWMTNARQSLAEILNPPFRTPPGYVPRAYGEVRPETFDHPTGGVSLEEAVKNREEAKKDYPEMFR